MPRATDKPTPKRGDRPPWSAGIIIRYTLLQVPGLLILILILLLVRRWVDLPTWFIGGLIALWLAKDIILFPFVWRAYDVDRPSEANSIIGTRGIAQERLDPSGYIRVRGELWRAQISAGSPPIERGQAVQICEAHGLTLFVSPADEKGST